MPLNLADMTARPARVSLLPALNRQKSKEQQLRYDLKQKRGKGRKVKGLSQTILNIITAQRLLINREYETSKYRKEQDKLINRLERQEKKQSLQRDRFLKYKLNEIHSSLTQELLMQKVVETDNTGAFQNSYLRV
jgi:hypothetical protein